MTAANTDTTNLNAQAFGGLIREDVMNKIWEIDKFPLPLTDMSSKGTHSNQYTEYTTDELGVASTVNKHVDGVDVDQNDSVLGVRIGNYTQTALKEIQISTRANSSNSIGNQGKLSYQVMQGQKRLRRDVEAQMCSTLPSVAGDGLTIPGQSAGLGAWITTNVRAGAGYVAGGFDDTTGLIDAPTPGTPEALSETNVRDVMQLIYEAGGDCVYMMATPTVIRLFSEYLFSASARIATMTNDNASGTDAMTAYGSANVFVGDHGQVVRMIPNRLQPEVATDVSNVYFLDPKHMMQSFMRGYQTEPLAKTGLSEKRLISVDYSFCVMNEKALGMIADVDETTPAIA